MKSSEQSRNVMCSIDKLSSYFGYGMKLGTASVAVLDHSASELANYKLFIIGGSPKLNEEQGLLCAQLGSLPSQQARSCK